MLRSSLCHCPDSAHENVSHPASTRRVHAELAKGRSFTAMGSPFGALAPAHFLNHTATGVISNILRPAVRPSSMHLLQTLRHFLTCNLHHLQAVYGEACTSA